MIDLSGEDRQRLQSLVRRRTAEQRMVVRARIVLAAAHGEENASIADRLGVALNTVIKWRKRFFEEGVDGLVDRKRSGRPRALPPLVVAEIKELARELVFRAVVVAISAATVSRVLRRDAIRPWLHRSWIFPRDPDFGTKAAVALDLYARVFEGERLGLDELVVSPMRRPASRPVAVAIPPCRRVGPG